eukprot:scaffold103675_cov70-Phaeocystis_antarctica.AAC.6
MPHTLRVLAKQSLQLALDVDLALAHRAFSRQERSAKPFGGDAEAAKKQRALDRAHEEKHLDPRGPHALQRAIVARFQRQHATHHCDVDQEAAAPHR